MVSTFTPNIQIEEPARGDDVGSWDTPVNNNMTLLDLVAGGIATISLNNSNVALSAGQFRSKMITVNSTLTGSVTLTFPTSFTKSYEIQNLCTGSSAFTVTLATTAAGGQVICAPPGETIDCFNDGTNIKFKNFGRIGEYWDFAGTAVPNWISGCTVPPYVQCVGGSLSSATYPVLFGMIGGTLPDSRGRNRMYVDAGVGRVSSGVSSVPGNTLFGAGGDQNLAVHGHAVTDPGHVHDIKMQGSNAFTGAGQGIQVAAVTNGGNTDFGNTQSNTTGITIQNAGAGAANNMTPTFVGGITMIRAA